MSFDDCLNKAQLSKADLVEWKEAKIIISNGMDQDGYEQESKYKGFILISKNKFIFVRDKGFITGTKIMYNVPLNKINNINKISLIHRIQINANVSEKTSNFLKKMFSGKNAKFDIKNANEFVTKIKNLIK